MNKTLTFILLLTLFCFSSFCPYCSELYEGQEVIPEWFKRVYYGIKVSSENKPQIFFETIQPIWKNKREDSLLFIQPHYSLQNNIKEYSLGLGCRHLLENKKLLLGINSFFDYQQNHEHYQLGLGFEAIGDIGEARINTYWGLSGKELILETTSYKEYEKVLNGLDAEIGFPIPYLPWAKIFGLGYYYDADHISDIHGWKTRLEIKPSTWITIDLGTQDDNHREQEWFAQAEIHLPPDRVNIERILVTDRMLDLVERNFSPIIETWQVEKKTVILGYLTNQRNYPLSNAKVVIHSKVVTTYTDNNGYFRATVTPGSHTIYIYSSDNRLLHSQDIFAEGDIIVDVSQTIYDPALDTPPTPEPTPEPTPNPASNSAPSINQLSANSSSITYPKTSEISFSVSDPDGDDVNWSANISGGPNKGSLSPSSGIVSGGSGDVYITYTPENTDNTFTIHVHLDDGHGNVTNDSVAVTVKSTSSPENTPPEISNLSADPNPITDPPHESNITFDVDDFDGDDVSWTADISAGPSPQGNITPKKGKVKGGSGTVTVKYTPKKGTPDGTFTITAELDDGNGGTDTESINIVLDRDRSRRKKY